VKTEQYYGLTPLILPKAQASRIKAISPITVRPLLAATTYDSLSLAVSLVERRRQVLSLIHSPR